MPANLHLGTVGNRKARERREGGYVSSTDFGTAVGCRSPFDGRRWAAAGGFGQRRESPLASATSDAEGPEGAFSFDSLIFPWNYLRVKK